MSQILCLCGKHCWNSNKGLSIAFKVNRNIAVFEGKKFIILDQFRWLAAPSPPPRKKGQNRAALAGQNNGDILQSLQFRKAIIKQYENTEQ